MKTNRTNFNGKRSFKIAVKRVLSSFIVFGMSLSLLPFEANAAGLPVVAGGDTINIGIASDIHINREDSASGKVREALLRQSLKGFYTATGNNLDAVAIAGDIADDGYVDELKTARSIIDAELASTTGFTAAMGNHEFYKYGWGASVDRNAGWKEEMQKDFTDNIKVPLEHDLNVKGIHILSVSPDNELDSYTARESFLKTHIEAAAQEDPTNPIIIVAHKPVKYTVMSSGDGFEDNYASFAADWSDSFLEFLKKYPQIIYFSAHAHDDLSNEDNIFQKDFTSVQDGAVCLEGASTGVIVSVNAAKQVTISRMNFSANTSYEPWIIDIPKVIESKENFKYLDTIKNINLTVGADASQIHVNWFNEYFKNGKVQYLKKAHMTDGTFSSLKEINAYGKGRVDYSTLYYNHALLTNLEENTEYVYRVGNDNGWSEYYTFKTPAAGGAFSFLFAADPQIGSTNVVSDAAGWRNTLDKALEAFPDTQILLTGGDHVDSAFSSSDYDGFFSPEQLTGLPIATVVGNHDISRIYSQHFAYSNVSPETSLKLTGENSGDYWFIRNNTLFLMLNSSVLDSQEHINFMQKAIMDAKKTGAEIKWKVAMFHYSIFSTAMHSDEEDIIKRREGLAPAFSDLQVDLVLMGHDHSYTRTYMMNGKNPVITAEVQNSVTDPEAGQVLYVTGSSSSGSKYYDYETVDAPYAAVNYNNKATSISNVAVSDTALTITTYNPKDMTVIDSFTINKTQVSGSDTLKPYLNIPTTNTVILNEPFDRLAGVSAIDNIDGDITNKIIVTGEVNTSAVGTYTLTYTITDMAGNTQTATREITVKKPADTTGSLYFGIDIKNGKLQNEEGSAVTGSTYTKTSGGYDFERDNELNQTVLCGPDKGNLRIDGLNLKALDNQFTIETYIKIPGDVTAYNVFQFEDQSINLVGRPCEGYPGETYFGAGKTQITEDADVYAMKKLPTDKWVHILCTAKEGEQTLYVNGERFSSDSYTKLDISTSSNDVLVLGGDDGERGGRIKFAGFRAFTNFVNDGQAKEIYTDRTKLKTPQNLKWDAGIPGKAVWETVENASSYTVQLYRDGLESGSAVTGIADTSYDFTQAITAEGVYTFKVTAMGKGTAYSNSDTSSKSAAYFYTTSVGALKPSISIPDANRVVLNGSFDKLADVSAEDRVDGDITDKITVSGDVNTSAEGEYTLTYTVKNSAGITASVTRRVVVKKYFYFGIDIKNGKLENEKYFKVTDSTYIKTGAEPDNIYLFERDGELGQNVLCGPAAENLVINKLNLKEFGNKFTVETYIKIPGNIGAYDVFQFDGQNVNLVGLPGETYFGSGKSSSGDADVYADKNLPVDQWIHVICTAKEGVQTLYVNGQKFSSDNYTGLNIAPTGYDELVLGGSSAGRSGLIKYAFFRVYSDFVTDEEAAELYTSLKKLSTPDDLAWDSVVLGRATWGTVANAGSYTVQLYRDGLASGSEVSGVTNSYYDFTTEINEPGSYTYTVTAVGNGINYSNSDTSAISGGYAYTLPPVELNTPQAVLWDSVAPGRATWEAVGNASSYAVQLYRNGAASSSRISGVTDTWYDFIPSMTGTGAYTFTVTAVGDGTAYTDSNTSAMSEVYSYRAPAIKLSTPGAIAWDGTVPGRATWGTVENAGSYAVQLFRDGAASGNEVQGVTTLWYDFNPTITSTGAYSFTVRAIGDGTTYGNGDSSSVSEVYCYEAPASAVTLSTPGAIAWDSVIPGKATWEPVANADSYAAQLYLNGVASGSEVSNAANTYYDFTPVITATGRYTFTVRALGNGTTYENSGRSPMSGIYYYTYVVPAPSNNNTGGGSTSSGTSSAVTGSNVQKAAVAAVNGKTKDIGTLKTSTNAEGQTVATVTVDAGKLKNLLETEDKGAAITIQVTGDSEAAECVLTGEIIKNIADRNATLVIESDSAVYTLPASAINLDSISRQFGTNVALSDITVTVKINRLSDKQNKAVDSAAKLEGFTVIVPSLEFTVNFTNNGKTVEAGRFNTYVERLIAIPSGVDTNKITTGILVKPDGTTYPVPTEVVTKDGRDFAKINSLTNSIYAVVYHPVKFADTAKHWAGNVVNDLGSRMIVSGDENGNYRIGENITRAEFAALIIRALGLAPGTGKSEFGDVSSEERNCGYIQTAVELGIINGFKDGLFRPGEPVTREQAMAMLTKAMEITGLESGLTGDEINELLAARPDGDKVSSYAKKGVAACLHTGIVSGRNDGTIAPKGYCTRAEAAVIVQGLLKKSKLI